MGRASYFLVSVFLSAIGDSLLLFAVPTGLGLETNDMRMPVLMWLVPSVAMFVSSFFGQKMTQRKSSIRKDYGRLLLALAVVEIIVAVTAWLLRTPVQTVILISLFVFVYALIKEGIPRLLYQVAVYRFFVEEEKYTVIAAAGNGLSILASFIGTIVAAFLIKNGDWRIALIVDSISFIILGLTVLIIGKDENEKSPTVDIVQGKNLKDTFDMRWIAFIVPILFGVNAVVWNNLPLISQNQLTISASEVIFLISLFRLPGLLCSFFIGKIQKLFSAKILLYAMPLIYVLTITLFSIFPSIIFLKVIIFWQGMVSGIYWALDYSFRNQLPYVEMIKFNTKVLRKLSVFQFISCCSVMILFRPEVNYMKWIPVILTIIYALSFLSETIFSKRKS